MAYTFKESTGENARAKWSESVGANGGVKFKGADNQSDLPSQANFILPSFETWNGNTLNSGSITRTLNIPNGTYTLSIEIAAINQNGNINADNIVLLANGNQLGKLSNQGNSFSNGNVNGRSGVYKYENVAISNGQLAFSIQLNDGHNANWILFKNLTVTNSNGAFSYSFTPYSGWVYKTENDGARPSNLKYDGGVWQTKADDPRLGDGVQIQRTHEIEHVVWCMPGETCELTPYTDFTHTARYRDNYIRWYNYPTGNITGSNLTFPYPGSIITLNEGYFGGSELTGEAQDSYPRKFGTKAIFTAPNSNDDILGTIAIEASTQFSYNYDGVINEPTLMFRTIFVIKNAKNRADAMAANNAGYIADNRIKLMAPANTPFQYHLPSGEDRKFAGSSSPSTPGNLISSGASDFQNGNINGWAIAAYNNNGGNAGADCTRENGDYYMHITNTTSATNAWDAQAIYQFNSSLNNGTYTLSFKAKANATGNIQFGFQDNPHNNGGPQIFGTNITVGTDWTTYTWNNIQVSQAGINAMFINLGKMVGYVDIDDIVLKKSDNNTNLVTNGGNDFKSGVLGGWSLNNNNNNRASLHCQYVNGGDTNSWLHLYNTTLGDNDYSAQCMYSLGDNALAKGNKYQLTFWARANQNAEIQFGAQFTPWDSSNKEFKSGMVSLNGNWTQYSIDVELDNSYPDAGLNTIYFNFGKMMGDVYIDKIELKNAAGGTGGTGGSGGSGGDVIPTDYFYKDGSEYKSVNHYLIETWKADIDGHIVGTAPLGRTININGDAEVMTANGSLAYTNKVIKGGFNDVYINDVDQMLYIQNPQAGNYVIKIYALDESTYTGSRTDVSSVKPIYIGGDTSKPLELMEYELEIMDPKEGNMITEEELNSNTDYQYQRQEALETMFGNPTTKINFDDNVTCWDGDNGSKYHKWPLQWELSSYGFSYDKPKGEFTRETFDYNYYVLVDYLSAVTYAASSMKEENAEKNKHDRKYADSNGAEKGFMYYVNAATDPGRMATLNIGRDFCDGTRVYVSAWVMETNNGPETANVVFSFKGVAADGTETTLSSFVTGYVRGGVNTDAGGNTNNNGSYDTPSSGIDDRGKWMHVYYNFYPSVSATSKYDHFIITLENNCTSSSGADYVIDDIRAFVCKPLLNALQENPVCNGDPATKLKLSTDFDRLLSAIGRKESKSESMPDQFYYCFIDSAAYVNTFERTVDSLVAKGKTETEAYSEAYPIAFNAAMVKKVYGKKAGSTTEFEEYGVLKYNRHFESNLAAPTSAEEEATMPERTAYRESNLTKRLLNFPSNSNVNDTKIRFGTKYWAVMEGDLILTDGKVDIPNTFDLRDNCTSKNLFEVIFSGEIKVDGMLRSEQDGINICSNQRPVITIDLNGISGNAPVVTEKAYFDWYFGPGFEPKADLDEDYTQYLDMEVYDGVRLVEALEGYRLRYPNATATTKADFLLLDTDGSALDPNDPTIVYTDGMQACIAHYLDLGMIALYQQSGIVSSAKYSDILGQGEVRKYYISAVPWNPNPEDKTVKYCLKPIQITLKADTRYPTMKDGNDDPNQVTYPTEIRDVPLRTGLRHLQAASHLTYNDPENVGAVIPTKPSWLLLPLRDVSPITQEIKILGLADDVLIYLADSNDPWVNTLYKNEKGKLVSKSGAKIVKVFDDDKHYKGDWSNTDVKFIGEVLEITAEKGKLGSYCKLAFYDDFKFREGYYYTIKFMFNEIYETGYTGAKDAVCPGEVICTIKVVPEYQKWTGAVDSNWNNDANWSRVSFEDLKYDPEILTGKEYEMLSDLVTNAEIDDIEDTEGKKDTYANDNKRSYVPAEFTKVIIPADAPNMPIMYDLHNEANVVGNVKYAGSPVSCYSIKYMTPQEAIADGETTVIPFYDEYAERIDTATANINFDMASVVITKDNAQTVEDKKNINMVACVSWFDHTCEQIHFESRAEMLNQQFLKYEKASADFEIEPDRWYTMSSPLQNVVSGDMYLPTATARQETPYFKSIYYDVEKNDRFTPAVYQRKWNAQNATLFHLDKSRAANEQVYTTNAAEGISLDWSHVYNDTNEDFGSGAGFSIKADVSAIDSDPTKRPKQVMFRLPKADVAYTYFSPGNTDSTYRSQIEIPETMLGADGERTGRLVDSLSIMTGEGFKSAGNYANDTKSHYFLVGNPLMCTIDLAAFFDANPTLERKFWLLTKDGQRAAVMDEDGVIVSSTGEGFIYPYIKPFQSFFVVTKEDATTATDVSFTPKFTADMMHLSSSNDQKNPNEQGFVVPGNSGAKTRAAVDPSGIMRITATDDRGLKSAMVITDAAIRHTSGAEALFDSNLADEPMVYSVIDGQAMTIGEMKAGQTIPVGLAGIEGEATITISGIDSFSSPVYVIDAQTGETTPLTSDMTLTQTGNGVRYYLAVKASAENDAMTVSAPVVQTNGGHLTVKAPSETEIEKVQVFGTNGMCVAEASNAGMQYDTDLVPGIYIVRLTCGGKEYQYKIVVRA